MVYVICNLCAVLCILQDFALAKLYSRKKSHTPYKPTIVVTHLKVQSYSYTLPPWHVTVAQWQSQADAHTMVLVYYRNGNIRGIVNDTAQKHDVQMCMLRSMTYVHLFMNKLIILPRH